VKKDCLGIANPPTQALEGSGDFFSSITEPRINDRREARVGIDDGERAQLSTCGRLVVEKGHRPGLVDLHGGLPVLAQLRLHPALGCLVPELQAHLFVKAIDPLRFHRPAIPLQQDMHATIPVADTGLADLLDAVLEIGLTAAPRLGDMERPIDLMRCLSAPR
jgi:hypothetical protein